jgi:hypothetical protein
MKIKKPQKKINLEFHLLNDKPNRNNSLKQINHRSRGMPKKEFQNNSTK